MTVWRKNGRRRKEEEGEGKLYVEPTQNLQLCNQLRLVGEQAPLSVQVGESYSDIMIARIMLPSLQMHKMCVCVFDYCT